MKLACLFFATLAVAASAAGHAWLFAPFAAMSVPVPIDPRDDEPEKEERKPAPPVELDTAPPAQPAPKEPAPAPPAGTGPVDPAGTRSIGEPRADLAIEIEVDDEKAILAYAHQHKLQLAMVAEDTRQVWPLHIADDGRLDVLAQTGPGTGTFLMLPHRDGHGRANRLTHWGALARSIAGVPHQLATQLALELPDDALDRAARDALRAHCATARLAVAEVRRVVVCAVLVDGVASLAVTKVVLP